MTTLSAAPRVRLVNPLGRPHGAQARLAPRVDTLDGRTVGLIDNIKPNAGLFLDYVEEMIRADYPRVKTTRLRKNFTSSRLIADQFGDEVKAVVNAWGD